MTKTDLVLMQRQHKRYNFPVKIVAAGYRTETHACLIGADMLFRFEKTFPYPCQVEDENLDYLPSNLGGYILYNFEEERFYVGKEMSTMKLEFK